MNLATRRTAAVLTGLVGVLGGLALAAPASADDRREHRSPVCGDLAGRAIGGARILAAEAVAASATLPAYCRVRGLIEPKLNFELS